MKFSCETEDLSAVMSTASRVIKAKSPQPILLNVKVVTNDNRVTFVGSDGDTTFELDVPATIETEGADCLPFLTFAKFVNAAKGSSVSIATSDGNAVVKSGRGRIKLLCGPIEDYPTYRPAEGEPVVVDGPSFCHALRFCVAAASKNEVQYNLCGVGFVESDEDEDVVAWGTDGKVAHRAALTGLGSVGGGATVPSEAAQIILSVAEKSEDVRVLICHRGWGVEAKGIRVWGKVIDSQYPDMKKVVAQAEDWHDLATVEHDAISTGIEVAGCGADTDSTRSRGVILNCTPDEPLILRGARPVGEVSQAGRAEVEAAVTDAFSGAFNSSHIKAALTGLKMDRVAIRHSRIRGTDNLLKITPAQESATIDMSAVIFGMRMSDAELTDG